MSVQSQAFGNIDNTKNWIGQYGPGIMNQLNDEASAYQQRGLDYTDWANSGYNALQQNPGYTGSQQDQIMNGGLAGGYNSLLPSSQDLNNNFLTSTEQSQITGNPYAAQSAFSPEFSTDLMQEGQARTNDQVRAGVGNVNQAVGNLRSGLDASVTPDLQLDPGYTHTQENTVDAGAHNVRGALNTGGNAMRGSVNNLQSSVNAGNLNASGQYMNQMDVTPAQMDQIRSAGARSIAAQNTAAQQQVRNALYQGGSSNPFAEAALQSENARASEASEADAALNGELAAQNTARGVAQAREDTRMKGAAGAGNLNYQTGMAGLNTEGQLMGANTAAENSLLGTALNTQQSDEAMRLAAAQKAAGMRQYNAATAGGADIAANEYGTNLQYNNSTNSANTANEMNRYNQGTAMNLAQQADNTTSQRAGQIASNRQGVNQYNGSQQYARGMGVAQANTTNATNVANAQRSDLGAVRNYAAGQGQFNTQTGMQGRGQQLTAYGTTAGGLNTADSNYVGATRTPGMGQQIWGAIGNGANAAANAYDTYSRSYANGGTAQDGDWSGGGNWGNNTGLAQGGIVGQPMRPSTAGCMGSSAAIGKVITNPTPVMLGENGPEIVIPLQKLDDAMSSMATLDRVNPGVASAVAMRGALQGTGESANSTPSPVSPLRARKLPKLSYSPVMAAAGGY